MKLHLAIDENWHWCTNRHFDKNIAGLLFFHHFHLKIWLSWHLAQQRHKTTVVIDNASIHTSDQFEENIPKWEEQGLFIKFFPSYSPELNKIKILWKHIKYHCLDFKAYSSFTNFVRHVENILRGVGSQYRINFS